ncbi:MAG: L-glutamate gamma-semialdehyde dehydrogenase [Acidobacteriota bacterium]
MANGIVQLPPPVNEPVRSYAPGTPERASLQARLGQMLEECPEIPTVIGGERLHTGDLREVVCPHDHGHVLARIHQAGAEEARQAADDALAAWQAWSEMPWEARAAIFLKAADLLAGPWRDTVNAATMLGQSKTVYQAEIDSACELIDFWRFNVHFMDEMYRQQPISPAGVWNRVEYRPLEGFVLAITPFNFTAIGGNLPTAPAMLGNVALWKPAETATLASWMVWQILEEAGLPAGVVNFLPGDGPTVGGPLLERRELAAVHFTGSTGTFQHLWREVGNNIERYDTYPRLVGETGGKDFVFAHPTADVAPLSTALVRGAFEFQGQKCSAASRAYLPRSLWPEISERLTEEVAAIPMGSPVDFGNFMTAVIDAPAFQRITSAIERARAAAGVEVLCGGGFDDSTGYFIEPTVLVVDDPRYETMEVELFGPVLTIYVYDDEALEETLELCDATSPYALTGAIWGRDRQALEAMSTALRHAAGNFYINDKPTGAVVGQQPFGGARASGTNDKAGSIFNLLRWVSQRTIKETFVPPTDVHYPFMESEE